MGERQVKETRERQERGRGTCLREKGETGKSETGERGEQMMMMQRERETD